MAKECKKCGKKVVHDNRKWLICLDCFIDIVVNDTIQREIFAEKYLENKQKSQS